jgi:hypothetical protein
MPLAVYSTPHMVKGHLLSVFCVVKRRAAPPLALANSAL